MSSPSPCLSGISLSLIRLRGLPQALCLTNQTCYSSSQWLSREQTIDNKKKEAIECSLSNQPISFVTRLGSVARVVWSPKIPLCGKSLPLNTIIVCMTEGETLFSGLLSGRNHPAGVLSSGPFCRNPLILKRSLARISFETSAFFPMP